MTVSIRARVVYPVDRPPIEHGVVTIESEHIVAVGTKSERAEMIDLGSVALLPGLVNAHTHLEFSHLKRPLGEPGMRLVDWIRLVIAERGHSGNNPSGAIAQGFAESVGHGVMTVGDITTTDADASSILGADLTQLLEVIGFSRARSASACLALTERMHARATDPTRRFGISPHAPYTVSPELLGELVSLARARDIPVAMHLAESADELELLRDGTGPFRDLLEERSMWDAKVIPRGTTPLDYLRMLAEAPRALVIHGNYLSDEEHAFLAARADRMSLVYCPRTHSYFGHPPYPLAELLRAGVRVALGTDSRASNPDLDLLAEMRYVAATHTNVNPTDVLRMGTLSGAEALRREADVGSITPGKLANLITVPLRDESNQSAEGMLRDVLTSADEGEPPGLSRRDKPAGSLGFESTFRTVWVRGRKL